MTRTPLVLLPIEPLDERYTASWYRNMPPAFEAAGFDVTVIDGQVLVENDIKVGTFLDINSTTHYKQTQLQQISRMFAEGKIADGTMFFVADLEFWGIEQIRLMADMNRVKIKMVAFLHAASYTHGDAFEIAAPYQQFTEVGWIACMDAVFVGSEYHQQAVVNRRLKNLGTASLAGRIHVTKNPMFGCDYQFTGVQKERVMLLTNRFDTEKDVGKTLNLFATLKAVYPGWRFVITTGRKTFRSNNERLVRQARDLEEQGVLEIHAGLGKAGYHLWLERAAIVVSHSPEENYGLCVAESIIYGAIPLLRDCASHPEFVGDDPWYMFDHSNALKTYKGSDVAAAGRLIEFANQRLDSGEGWGRKRLAFDWSGMDNIIKIMRDLVAE